MATSRKRKRLTDAYNFAGFRAQEQVRGIFGDPGARIVTLVRRSKKQLAAVAVAFRQGGTTAPRAACAIWAAATHASTWSSGFVGFDAEPATP
jgi:hypothetical protein